MIPNLYGGRRVPRMMAEVRKHRDLVRSEGSEAIQASWDRIEEFIDFFYGEIGRRENEQPSQAPCDTT